jgi:Fic family protein
VLPASYLPDDNEALDEIEALYEHLVFALKYEGVNLLLFSCLAKYYNAEKLTRLASFEPLGQYSRRIWFLLEFVSGQVLEKENLVSRKQYVPVIDERLQYAVEGIKSQRHLVINNLPGHSNFCPLIRKTVKLETYLSSNLHKKKEYLNEIRKDILLRASAFLLHKDSKASFTIEGESPKSSRATRWGHAIAQAGTRDLTKEELIRLQQLVIESNRFVHMGFRKEGGFIGEHDRITGEPVPSHISAKWQDLDDLVEGLVKTSNLLTLNQFDAVLAATIVAFGFVFIHPFEDGNGRIHRYLIHHMLAKKQFAQQGIIFPVSSSILENIVDYRQVLESYSSPLLDLIEWRETKNHNIEVLNETIDYYRFFDATVQAEFLYDRVRDTIENIIPAEIQYLGNYDKFKQFLDDQFEMPDKTVALLVRFLHQNNGRLSQRSRQKEFPGLTDFEAKEIEERYAEIFM